MLEIVLSVPEESNHLRQGIAEIQALIPDGLSGRIIALQRNGPGLRVEKRDGDWHVIFHCASELFRGIGLVTANISSGFESDLGQDIQFKTLGVMYDCSRNSVPTVITLKRMLIRMALMGFNTLMLYTEDTYTLDSHPEFGHYRGRYSRSEIDRKSVV